NDFLNIVTRYGPGQLKYKQHTYHKNRFRRYVSTSSGLALADELRATGFSEKKEMMDHLSKLVDVKQNRDDRDYWLLMNEEEIRQLSLSPWVTIGCHGYYHNDLAKIDINDAREELIQSK